MSEAKSWDGAQCRGCGKVCRVSGNAEALVLPVGWWLVPVVVPETAAGRAAQNRRAAPGAVLSAPACSEACAVQFGRMQAARRQKADAFKASVLRYLDARLQLSAVSFRLLRNQGGMGEDVALEARALEARALVLVVLDALLAQTEPGGEVIVYDVLSNRPFAVAARYAHEDDGPSFRFAVRCPACDRYGDECTCAPEAP